MRRPNATTATMLAGLTLCVMAASPAAAQNDTSHRDSWQRVAAVLEAVGATPGARIADVGAGGGYFTEHLLRAVGDDGRVYAVDISRDDVARLRRAMDAAGARNVDVILGETDDPRLPWGALDGAIIINAYHEMTEYAAMLAGVRRALRPGGRLVIVDHPAGDGQRTREEQMDDHVIDIDLVRDELTQADFEIIEADSGFIDARADGHEHRMWRIIARRPADEGPAQRLPGTPAGADGLFACRFDGTRAELAERASAPDSAQTRLGEARVKVCYSRPATRGRVVMGELVPFGEPWRTGADEPTVLRTDRPLLVGDVRLEPGWYSLYTVPEPDRWTIVVNALVDRDGAIIDESVRSHDVGSVVVPVEETEAPVDRLTMRFEDAALVLEWERARVRIPIREAR